MKRLESFFATVSGIALFAMMALTFADVIGRKFVGNSLPGAVELTEIFMVLMIYFALPLASIAGAASSAPSAAAAVAVAPLVVVVHLIVVRAWLVREAMRLLGTARRRFVRWLARLGFLWIGVPGYGLAATPLLGIVPAVATFAGLTAAVHAYTSWSLTRESQRAPLAGWEKALLWGLALATLVALAGLAVLVALLGWSATAIADWLASR